MRKIKYKPLLLFYYIMPSSDLRKQNKVVSINKSNEIADDLQYNTKYIIFCYTSLSMSYSCNKVLSTPFVPLVDMTLLREIAFSYCFERFLSFSFE